MAEEEEGKGLFLVPGPFRREARGREINSGIPCHWPSLAKGQGGGGREGGGRAVPADDRSTSSLAEAPPKGAKHKNCERGKKKRMGRPWKPGMVVGKEEEEAVVVGA